MCYKEPASTEGAALSSNKGWLLTGKMSRFSRPQGFMEIWGSNAVKYVYPDIPIPSPQGPTPSLTSKEDLLGLRILLARSSIVLQLVLEFGDRETTKHVRVVEGEVPCLQ